MNFLKTNFIKFLVVSIDKSSLLEQEFTDLADSEICYTVFHADSHGVVRFSRKWITVAPSTCGHFLTRCQKKLHNFRILNRIEPKLDQ